MPPDADHVTAVFVVPVILAVNCCVAPVSNDAEVGLMAMATDTGEVTVTVAVADLVGSATLVAVSL